LGAPVTPPKKKKPISRPRIRGEKSPPLSGGAPPRREEKTSWGEKKTPPLVGEKFSLSLREKKISGEGGENIRQNSL